MKIKQIMDALEQYAPLPLQDGFDNAGLQIGLTEVEVTGALLCLDVTEAVIDEAIAAGCNLIVSHHPLLFHGLKIISNGTYVERCVRKAIKNEIAIYSSHTNLDNAVQGVNYRIAEKIGLHNVRLLDLKSDKEVVYGSGIVGELRVTEPEQQFLNRMKTVFECKCVRHNALNNRMISRVALCGGAGAFLLPDALRAQADAFLTGEFHYHDYFGYEQDLLMVELGHYESEQYTKELFRDCLNKQFPDLRIVMTKLNTNPIYYL